jgi:hypothetical protein
MTKYFDIQRIILWSAIFGVLYNAIEMGRFEYGRPEAMYGYIASAAAVVVGAAVALLNLVSGAHNVILKVK